MPGGTLIELLLSADQVAELKADSTTYESIALTPQQLCDLELLMCGGFSPLRGFLAQADYECVLSGMRLADGTVWPIPIMLAVPTKVADRLDSGQPLALRDAEGLMLAVMEVEELWTGGTKREAEALYGTAEPARRAWEPTLTSRLSPPAWSQTR